MPVIAAIKKHAKKTLDVHLMIVNPDQFISTFKKVGADILTVHYEACPHLHRTIQAIKGEGMQAGVSLNPHTPISVLEDIIVDLDVVLLMSVNPGFGGQSFIKNTYKKVRQLRDLIDKSGSNALIEIDGGVNDKTGAELLVAGADVLVAGSYVFKSTNPKETIELLKELETIV
jgi:ribulose-phosphate 3-epimerase